MIRVPARLKPWMALPATVVMALVPLLFLTASAQGCGQPAAALASDDATSTQQISIPQESDWLDYGAVIPSGPAGAWDDGLGMAPPMSTIVRKDGSFFFYYVGFDGIRASDEGERNRTVGVATSRDGIRFAKHEGNPIITYRPNNNEEEAAGGVAATVDAEGNIVMYWGAADAGSPTSTSVDSDIRLSTSSDGLTFTDQGDIISHLNPAVWGYGDELFPLGVYQYGESWHLYYIAKGLFGIDWDVGLASGPAPDQLTQTRCALAKGSGSNYFGGGSIVALGPDTYAIFLVRNNGAPFVEVRTFSPQTPHLLSAPVAVYSVPNLREATVFLDHERKTWFMYALDSSTSTNYFEWHIHLKLAPAGPPDTTPPGAPTQLAAVSGEPDGIALSWGAAEDADTGVVVYNIYRDGEKLGSTFDLAYRDNSEAASPTAAYEVSAVNLHGVEGARSGPVRVVPPPVEPHCYLPYLAM